MVLLDFTLKRLNGNGRNKIHMEDLSLHKGSNDRDELIDSMKYLNFIVVEMIVLKNSIDTYSIICLELR